MNIDISHIEIFACLDAKRQATITQLFSPRELAAGTTVLRHGEPVDGLYLLEAGEVVVSLPGFDGPLARLGPGKFFGELSLFKQDNLASATVTVASDSATLAFCPREELQALLETDEGMAAGFYHGSAVAVAERLTTTNNKISGEIAQSMKMASSLVAEIATSGNLGCTQQKLQTAGSHIVAGMTDLLKRLIAMKQSGEPISPEDIARLADDAKEIYYSEFQVFENVNTQLRTLGEHLDNVNRILSHQEPMDVDEDMELMEI